MVNMLMELFAGKPLGKLLEQKFGMVSLKPPDAVVSGALGSSFNNLVWR